MEGWRYVGRPPRDASDLPATPGYARTEASVEWWPRVLVHAAREVFMLAATTIRTATLLVLGGVQVHFVARNDAHAQPVHTVEVRATILDHEAQPLLLDQQDETTCASTDGSWSAWFDRPPDHRRSPYPVSCFGTSIAITVDDDALYTGTQLVVRHRSGIARVLMEPIPAVPLEPRDRVVELLLPRWTPSEHRVDLSPVVDSAHLSIVVPGPVAPTHCVLFADLPSEPCEAVPGVWLLIADETPQVELPAGWSLRRGTDVPPFSDWKDAPPFPPELHVLRGPVSGFDAVRARVAAGGPDRVPMPAFRTEAGGLLSYGPVVALRTTPEVLAGQGIPFETIDGNTHAFLVDMPGRTVEEDTAFIERLVGLVGAENVVLYPRAWD